MTVYEQTKNVVNEVKALQVVLKRDYGLTIRQATLVMALGDGDGAVNITNCRELLDLSAPSMTPLCDRLERDGIVERKRSTEDRRVVNLVLTNHGLALYQRMKENPYIKDHIGDVA